jgi:hypothetical protein
MSDLVTTMGITGNLGNEETMMLNPDWLTAGADMAIVAENGVAMFRSKDKDKDNKPPTSTATVPTIQGVSSGAMIAAAVILALAMLGSAMIIHHGLVA